MSQQQISEEELKNMSPEQIAEMQKQNCIFCHIIAGKVASKQVYSDDKVTAVLDINPANPGHVLLLPNEHYSIMPQIPEDILNHLFMVAKGISHACLKAFKAQGTNIFIANGVVAGQRAQHFMIHIIPRKENDGITAFQIPHKEISEGDLAEIRKVLKAKINQMMGIQEEVMDLDKAGKPEEKEAEFTEEKEGQKHEEGEKGEEAGGGQESSGETPEEEPEEAGQQEEGKKEEEEVDIDKIADMFK